MRSTRSILLCEFQIHEDSLWLDHWRPPSLSKLTPIIFDMGLTHLGLEAPQLVLSTSLMYFYGILKMT